MNSPSFFGIASVLLALLRPGVVVGQDIDVVELTTEEIQHAYAAGEYTSSTALLGQGAHSMESRLSLRTTWITPDS